MFTLTGFTEMERSRLRYALLNDDTSDFAGDPFVDEEMDLDIALWDLITLLVGVRDALYEPDSAGGGASKAPKAEQAVKAPKTEKKPREKSSSTPVQWRDIVEQLEAGAIDEFSHTMKYGTAASTKTILKKNYEGLDVSTRSVANGMAIITVKLAQ